MSRFEGDLHAAAATTIDAEELLAALGRKADADGSRSEAMACFLSQSQGWRDAAKRLGGAFAGAAAARQGLTGGKEE